MSENHKDNGATFMSRRTGIDRRWIPSPGHQPERRRGGDRRKQHQRSFLETLEGTDVPKRRGFFENEDDGNQMDTGSDGNPASSDLPDAPESDISSGD